MPFLQLIEILENEYGAISGCTISYIDPTLVEKITDRGSIPRLHEFYPDIAKDKGDDYCTIKLKRSRGSTEIMALGSASEMVKQATIALHARKRC